MIEVFEELDWKVLYHPFYSLHLDPSDVNLFGPLMEPVGD
jgi:hypothetical protein